MHPRINMITLGTRDLARARQFYAEGLQLPQKAFEGNICFFELHGSWLALYPWVLLAEDAGLAAIGSGFRGMSLAHQVSTPKEVERVINQAVQAGGHLIKEAQATAWGGFSGYFADLDGHLWEVAHNPFFWAGPAV